MYAWKNFACQSCVMHFVPSVLWKTQTATKNSENPSSTDIILTNNPRSQWRIQSFFGQTGTHIEPTKAPPWLACMGEIFWICTSRRSKRCTPWFCLFLDFSVKHFPNYLSLHYEKLLFRGWFSKNSYIQKRIVRL